MIAIDEDIMSPKYIQSSTLWEELCVNVRGHRSVVETFGEKDKFFVELPGQCKSISE